jgi:hypothetical protein
MVPILKILLILVLIDLPACFFLLFQLSVCEFVPFMFAKIFAFGVKKYHVFFSQNAEISVWIRDILVRILSGSLPLTYDPALRLLIWILLFSSMPFKMPAIAYYFLKVHLNQSS